MSAPELILALMILPTAPPVLSSPDTHISAPSELTGTRWFVESIDGTPPLNQLHPTGLSFSETMLSVGRGCYGFHARRLIEGAEKLFDIQPNKGPVIAFQCADQIVAQENAIAALIAGAVRAKRYANGSLVFTTDSGKTLTLRLSKL